jgi:type II secretory pathway pseudopilin PulG
MRIELSRARGSVLLEVVLAVVLFAAAATVVGVGLKASMDSAERLRMSTHASNLAITVASELQMGVRSLADTGPEAFGPPFAGWVWEITATPWNQGEMPAGHLMHVEIIVRHEPTGFVHRFAQAMQLDASTSADGTMQSPPPASPEAP